MCRWNIFSSLKKLKFDVEHYEWKWKNQSTTKFILFLFFLFLWRCAQSVDSWRQFFFSLRFLMIRGAQKKNESTRKINATYGKRNRALYSDFKAHCWSNLICLYTGLINMHIWSYSCVVYARLTDIWNITSKCDQSLLQMTSKKQINRR